MGVPLFPDGTSEMDRGRGSTLDDAVRAQQRQRVDFSNVAPPRFGASYPVVTMDPPALGTVHFERSKEGYMTTVRTIPVVEAPRSREELVAELSNLREERANGKRTLGETVELEHEILRHENAIRTITENPRVEKIVSALLKYALGADLPPVKNQSKLYELTDHELVCMEELMKERGLEFVYDLLK